MVYTLVQSLIGPCQASILALYCSMGSQTAGHVEQWLCAGCCTAHHQPVWLATAASVSTDGTEAAPLYDLIYTAVLMQHGGGNWKIIKMSNALCDLPGVFKDFAGCQEHAPSCVAYRVLCQFPLYC
jgi:hypothetical protein